MNLNFYDSEASIFGEKICLGRTSSGHYTISLTNRIINLDHKNPSVVLHITSMNELSREDKLKKAHKLHRQFGHAPERKLKELVLKSNKFNDDMRILTLTRAGSEIRTSAREAYNLTPSKSKFLSYDKITAIFCDL